MKLEEKWQLVESILSSAEEYGNKTKGKVRLVYLKFYLSILAGLACLAFGFFGFRGMNMIAIALLAGYFFGKTSTFIAIFKAWSIVTPPLDVDSLKGGRSSKKH